MQYFQLAEGFKQWLQKLYSSCSILFNHILFFFFSSVISHQISVSNIRSPAFNHQPSVFGLQSRCFLASGKWPSDNLTMWHRSLLASVKWPHKWPNDNSDKWPNDNVTSESFRIWQVTQWQSDNVTSESSSNCWQVTKWQSDNAKSESESSSNCWQVTKWQSDHVTSESFSICQVTKWQSDNVTSESSDICQVTAQVTKWRSDSWTNRSLLASDQWPSDNLTMWHRSLLASDKWPSDNLTCDHVRAACFTKERPFSRKAVFNPIP